MVVGRDLDPDPPVQLRRQQMIDDVEPLLALRIIGPRDVDDRDEPGRRIVAKELQGFIEARRIDGQRQLAECENGIQHRARRRGGKFRCDGLKLVVHSPKRSGLFSAPAVPQRSIVPVRRIFFCSISTP